MAALPKLPIPKVALPDDLPRRLAAWWDGRDYEAANDADASTAARSGTGPGGGSARLAALQVLWGEGSYSPVSSLLHERLSEGFGLEEQDEPALIGFSGADPLLVRKVMGKTSSIPSICEWRSDCADELRTAFPNFDVETSDVDRVSFPESALAGVYTHESFSFADHKSGLIARVFKALKPGAIWFAFDYAKDEGDAELGAAFASSWSEPQIPVAGEPAELAELAGFQVPHHGEDLTQDVVAAARNAFNNLGSNLESSFVESLSDVNKPLFLKELAWEAESWKWRLRALEAGLIQARLWKFQKPSD